MCGVLLIRRGRGRGGGGRGSGRDSINGFVVRRLEPIIEAKYLIQLQIYAVDTEMDVFLMICETQRFNLYVPRRSF